MVTGASGFVGGALVRRLALDNSFNGIVAAVRTKLGPHLGGARQVIVGDLLPDTDWAMSLIGVEAIVHTSARVHVMRDDAIDILEAYRLVNVEGTLNFARQAAKAGVRRFVFVSSIKVNGEATQPGKPFTAYDLPSPLDPYGVSKMEAEHGLRDIEAQTGMSVVIVRPPLVYGPGVKANFASMMRWVARDMPLPFGAIHNARSMVALENLLDLLVTCLKHPAAAGQTYLVSDGEDLSTSELLSRIAQAMGKKATLIPLPLFVLESVATLLGKRAVAQRLFGNLQVDIDKTRSELGWAPPISLDEGLTQAVNGM